MKKSGGKSRSNSLKVINCKIGARNVSLSSLAMDEGIDLRDNNSFGGRGAVGRTSGAGYCLRRGWRTLSLKWLNFSSKSPTGNGSGTCGGSVESGILRMERR